MKITKNKTTQIALVLAVFVFITGAWQLFVTITQTPEFVLPPPTAIAKRFVTMLGEVRFWRDTSITAHEIMLGFMLSVFIAVILGTLIAQFLVLEMSLLPYVIGFQAIPSIALAPIYATWFGFGIASKIAMVVTLACFPIMMMVIAGLQSSKIEQIQMLRSFGANRMQILLKVQIPNALPFFFTGLKLGVIMAVTGAVVAEFVGGAEAGLGYRTHQYFERVKITEAFATLVALGIMSITFHGIISKLKSSIVFWVTPNDGRV